MNDNDGLELEDEFRSLDLLGKALFVAGCVLLAIAMWRG